jgi:hypothetical protein
MKSVVHVLMGEECCRFFQTVAIMVGVAGVKEYS